MHPEILRELSSQRGSEMRARAQRATLARVARRGRRAGREADRVIVPAIPDFVDGSFLEEAAADTPRQVPAARHAA